MNLKYLTEAYIPEQILFRDEQIEQINKSITSYEKWAKGVNLIIYGRSGSGKTSTLKYISNLHRNKLIYVSGINQRYFSILKSLSGMEKNTRDEIMKGFIKDLKENPRVIIIDEIDKIKEVEKLIDELNHIYRETQIPIIICTNKFDFIKTLPEDARLTLFFNPVHFTLYNTPELYEILNRRLKLAEGDIPEDKKWLISAIASSEGSARLVLEITHSCICENNFSEEFIKNKLKEFQDKELIEYISKKINNTERRVLREILFLKESNQEIESKFIHQNLNISKGRLSQILDNLEFNGIISTNKKNYGGRKGQSRIIDMDDSEYNLLKDCKEI